MLKPFLKFIHDILFKMTHPYKQGLIPIKSLIATNSISTENALHVTQNYYKALLTLDDIIQYKQDALNYTEDFIKELQDKLVIDSNTILRVPTNICHTQ